MSKKNKKPMVLEELANRMDKGFKSVDKRFESIEKRMATKTDLNELANMVALGFEQTATKAELEKFATKADFFEMEQRLDTRLTKVENRVEDVHELFERVATEEILDLQTRVKVVERDIRTINKQLSP